MAKRSNDEDPEENRCFLDATGGFGGRQDPKVLVVTLHLGGEEYSYPCTLPRSNQTEPDIDYASRHTCLCYV